MYTIRQTAAFQQWIKGLKDRPTRLRLLRRLEKAQRGLLGDVASVGQNVYEMREFFGPGWRMYYLHEGDQLILMLGGGDKSSQSRDIEAVKKMAQQLRG